MSATGGNSIFIVGETVSDFFSDFLPVAMALHSGQGCSPSKVWETASDTDCVRRLFASIVVHATVWSAAQCMPVVNTSAATTRYFLLRANTTDIILFCRAPVKPEGAAHALHAFHQPCPGARLIFQISEPAAQQKIFIERPVVGDLDIEVGIKAYWD